MSPSEQHDFNFCFAVPSVLENDRVRVTPFIPPIHLPAYFAASERHPEVYKYLPWGPFSSQEDLSRFIEKKFSKDPGCILFAVFDKTKPALDQNVEGSGAIAGLIAYQFSSVANLCTEIGAVIVLPQFQRKKIASNAVGLLLSYALNLPTYPSLRGLGLRRVVWQANHLNAKSIQLAQHLGFQMEGSLRWDRVLPAWKEMDVGNGRSERDGDPRAGCLGRDTTVLSLCWDDWENGGRERVAGLMERP